METVMVSSMIALRRSTVTIVTDAANPPCRGWSVVGFDSAVG